MRERDPQFLIGVAEDLMRHTGYDELGLLSLSTSDYSGLGELATGLLERFEPKHVSLSLPSLRIDNFSLDLMRQVSRTRRSGLTFAPEAGSQRLRDVINKGITEEDLDESLRLAFEDGQDRVKLYFMLGLPTETDEDVLAIAALCRRALELYREYRRSKRRLELSISVALFIPKPHTPFQWAPQPSREEFRRRCELLREALPRAVRFSYHEPEMSYWEAVLSRSDRRLLALLEAVWRRGQRFDSWDEYFDAEVWASAAEELGIDCDAYARRERALDEPLPWGHMDSGVRVEWLQEEWRRAAAQQLTTECRLDCSHCGAARYMAGVCPTGPGLSRPATPTTAERRSAEDTPPREGPNTTPRAPGPYYRMHLAREGAAAWLSHLDMMRSMERSFRRADILVQHSQGFNPRPQLIFALPAGVSVELVDDLVDVELVEPLPAAELERRLSAVLPPGIRVSGVTRLAGRSRGLMTAVEAADYRFDFPGAGAYAAPLLALDALMIEKRSKRRGLREVDIRPLILEAEALSDEQLRVRVRAGAEMNLRPDDLLTAMVAALELPAADAAGSRIVREALYTAAGRAGAASRRTTPSSSTR